MAAEVDGVVRPGHQDAGVTDTHFFERADMTDTKVGTDKKAAPADVAKAGFEAMLDGESDVVAGWNTS